MGKQGGQITGVSAIVYCFPLTCLLICCLVFLVFTFYLIFLLPFLEFLNWALLTGFQWAFGVRVCGAYLGHSQSRPPDFLFLFSFLGVNEVGRRPSAPIGAIQRQNCDVFVFYDNYWDISPTRFRIFRWAAVRGFRYSFPHNY